MRRRAVLALVCVLAPAAVRLGAASMDVPAVHCPMECHRGAAVNGAACCPMAGGPAGLEFRCCSHASDFVPTPLGHTPMLPPFTIVLSLPWRSGAVAAGARPDLRSAFLRSPDKVPLRSC